MLIEDQVIRLRNLGAYAPLPEFGLIRVSGKGAAAFLQSQTTNDVARLPSGQGQLNSLIDRTAHVQSLFSLHRLDDAFWLILPRNQTQATIDRLEQYHFNEELEITDLSGSGSFFTLQGPRSVAILVSQHKPLLASLPMENSSANLSLWQTPVMVTRKSITGEEGFFFWVASEHCRAFESELARAASDSGLLLISPEALETARIEAGIPWFGKDITCDELLPDTALEDAAVSYTKGCYPGQEVIARIKTYSAPRKGLVGLLLTESQKHTFPIGAAILIDGKDAGSVRSNAYSPLLKRTIAMAYVMRDYRVPGKTLSAQIDTRNLAITITLLPFYRAPDSFQRARSLYDAALSSFAEDRTQEAISFLREALDLDPLFADAYEALGVILSRQDDLDEAIVLMKKLAEIDSQCIMAHTNLSIFYMQQGNKEAAEEEKAIAMSIRMEKLAREMNEQRLEAEEKQKNKAEALERIAMFEQVLEIDPDDQLANYGLGNLYVEIEEFEKAVPYLLKAVQLKPNHSVAYLALGKAYAASNDHEQAIEIFRRGISIAAKQGDMTPLKDMQQRLYDLENRQVRT